MTSLIIPSPSILNIWRRGGLAALILSHQIPYLEDPRSTGAPNGKFWKTDLKTTKRDMNKAFWSHFKHFERLLGKIYLLLTPSKTARRFPSQQGAPTTCNLTYREVSQQTSVQTLPASFGLVGQNSRFRRRKRGGSVGKWVWPIKGEIHRFSGGGGGAVFWLVYRS